MYREHYRLLLSFSRVGFWGEGRGGEGVGYTLGSKLLENLDH